MKDNDNQAARSKAALPSSRSSAYTKNTDELARWLDSVVAPNVYAVVHLRKSHDGIMGNREAYDQAACDFMKRVSQRLFKSNYWRRPPGKRLIPNFATLEFERNFPHLNLLMRKPDWIEFADFRDILEELWTESPWAVLVGRDKTIFRTLKARAFWCEEREAGCNPNGYSLKEGTDALLLRSLSI